MDAKLQTGAPIVLDMHDHAHRAVFFYGEAEAETAEALRGLLESDAVFFDVGANVGYYSLLARDLGARDVHAFEPNPQVADLFARSLACRGDGIVLNRSACGEAAARMDLHLPRAESRNTGIATLHAPLADSTETLAVDVITIDDYCASRGVAPTLMKIDVEGFEASVLRGARATLRDHRPTVLCEVRTDEPRAILSAFGYRETVLARNEHFSDSLFQVSAV